MRERLSIVDCVQPLLYVAPSTTFATSALAEAIAREDTLWERGPNVRQSLVTTACVQCGSIRDMILRPVTRPTC